MGLDVRHRHFPGVYPWVQDGWTSHVRDHRGCRSFRSLGTLRHSQRADNCGFLLSTCRRALTYFRMQEHFYRHFMARALGLIVWPFIIYLSFFWVHFKVLKYSGTGDSFMSPAFQESLSGNELLLNSQGMLPEYVAPTQSAHPYCRDPLLRHDHPQAQGYEGLSSLPPGHIPTPV